MLSKPKIKKQIILSLIKDGYKYLAIKCSPKAKDLWEIFYFCDPPVSTSDQVLKGKADHLVLRQSLGSGAFGWSDIRHGVNFSLTDIETPVKLSKTDKEIIRLIQDHERAIINVSIHP